MPNVTIDEVKQTFHKFVVEIMGSIAEQEKTGNFYFNLLDASPRIQNSRTWKQINLPFTPVDYRPKSDKSSSAIDELIAPQSSVKMQMTCQMSVQLAYYGAFLKTLKTLSPENLSLFDQAFPSNDFVLRDFEINAGGPFNPSINHIACLISDKFDVDLHPLYHFITQYITSNHPQLSQKIFYVGDTLLLENFPDFGEIRQFNIKIGNETPPSRRNMMICTHEGGQKEARFTTFGFKGQCLTIKEIAEEMAENRNTAIKQLEEKFSYRYQIKEPNELIQWWNITNIISYHRIIDWSLLGALINQPQTTLKALTLMRKTMKEEVNILQNMELKPEFKKESMDAISATAIGILKNEKSSEVEISHAKKLFLQLLYWKHNECFELYKSGQLKFENYAEKYAKYEISTHYNLGRCYEKLGNIPAALTHFKLCVELAQSSCLYFVEAYESAYQKYVNAFQATQAKVFDLQAKTNSPSPSP